MPDGAISPPPAPDSAALSPYAKPGPYTTQLPPAQEATFQQWVKQNKIPWQDSPTADYDMRGFWKAQQAGDPNAKRAANRHFPDTWKTPYHKLFSNESKYATADAPHWEGEGDQAKLVSTQRKAAMPSGQPDLAGMVGDPEFQRLAPGDQREALRRLTGDASFTTLSDGDIGQFVSRIGKSTIIKPEDAWQRSHPELEQQTQAAAPKTSTKPFFEKPPVQATIGAGKDKQELVSTSFPPTNPIEQSGQRQDLLARREQRALRSPTPFTNASAVFAPIPAARQIVGAKAGGYLGRKAAPLVGVSPEAGEFAGGTVGGLIAGAAPKAIETEMPIPSVKLRSKFKVGPFDISRNVPPNPYEEMGESAQYQGMAKDATKPIPPPPPTPEEIATQRATQKVAQRTADEKAGLRRPQVEVEAERQAKLHEAAYNKEADEHAAIQKRLDAETSAQAAAERAARAHGEKLGKQRLAADAAQTQYYDEMEKARVAEADAQAKLEQARVDGIGKQIEQAKKDAVHAATDRHRMNTMYGDDLMKRGRETKELEAEAERLAGEVEKAATKAANSKRELALRATNMQKLRVARAEAEAMAGGPASVSPEVWKALSQMDKARIIARYENTKLRASEQGMVHAGRGATGPQLSNEAIRLPRPPEP